MQPLGRCEQEVPARTEIRVDVARSPSPLKAVWSPESEQALRWRVLGQKLGFQPRSPRFGAAGARGVRLQQVEMALVAGEDGRAL